MNMRVRGISIIALVSIVGAFTNGLDEDIADALAVVRAESQAGVRGMYYTDRTKQLDEQTGTRVDRQSTGEDQITQTHNATFFGAIGNRIEEYRRQVQLSSAQEGGYRYSSVTRFEPQESMRGSQSSEVSENQISNSSRVADQAAHPISFVNATGVENADVLIVYGPLQLAEGSLLDVLGQEFDISQLDVGSAEVAALAGRVAYVEAERNAAGFLVTRLEVFEDYAVPGATPVYVQGNLQDMSPDVGRIQIGNLQIDITGLLADSGLTEGGQMAIPGIQPVPGGLILGQQQPITDRNLIGALETSKVAGISGSSGRGISGSSGRGISGSSGR